MKVAASRSSSSSSTAPQARASLAALALAGLLLVLAPAGLAQGSLPRIVTIHPETRYQTFSGWEAIAALGAPDDGAAAALRPALVDRVVHDLGISRLRVQVRGGSEQPVDNWARWQAGEIDTEAWLRLRDTTINDDGDPTTINAAGFQFSELDATVREFVLPIARRLEERGERLQLHLSYVAGPDAGAQGTAWVHQDPAEYAEFVLATYEHLRDTFDLLPDSWEVLRDPSGGDPRVGEPIGGGGWDGQALGRAVVASAARLTQAGFTPRFVAPSSAGPELAASTLDELATVRGATAALAEVSYHRTDRVGAGRAGAGQLPRLLDRARQHGLELVMLEGGSSFDDLLQDLTTGQVVAWNGGPALLGDSPGRDLYSVDRRDPDRPRLTLNLRARDYQQAMRAVRPGMTRIRVTTRSSTLQAVAFQGEDGSIAIVIRGLTEGPIAIEGLPAGTYGTNWTTVERADVPGFDVDLRRGARLETGLPLPGVLSVFSR